MYFVDYILKCISLYVNVCMVPIDINALNLFHISETWFNFNPSMDK